MDLYNEKSIWMRNTIFGKIRNYIKGALPHNPIPQAIRERQGMKEPSVGEGARANNYLNDRSPKSRVKHVYDPNRSCGRTPKKRPPL